MSLLTAPPNYSEISKNIYDWPAHWKFCYPSPHSSPLIQEKGERGEEDASEGGLSEKKDERGGMSGEGSEVESDEGRTVKEKVSEESEEMSDEEHVKLEEGSSDNEGSVRRRSERREGAESERSGEKEGKDEGEGAQDEGGERNWVQRQADKFTAWNWGVLGFFFRTKTFIILKILTFVLLSTVTVLLSIFMVPK